MLKVVLDLLVGVSLDLLLVQVRGYALRAVEDRLAHTAVSVGIDRDFDFVLAHIAHGLHRLKTVYRCLGHGLLCYNAVLRDVG